MKSEYLAEVKVVMIPNYAIDLLTITTIGLGKAKRRPEQVQTITQINQPG